MMFFRIVIEIILSIFVFFMTFQITTIIHEFGHAIPALILTRDRVKIALGILGRLNKNNKNFKQISLKRLDIEIKSLNPFIGMTYYKSSQLTKYQRIVILAGGPIFSLLLAIIMVFINIGSEGKFLMGIFNLKEITILARNIALVSFLFTSIPIIYPKSNHPSDGYQILKLIKDNKIN
ncbi:site-2 protease family protein [Senegalia massiliensis]|uniref:site-2 protease family protein n=1 Tax=Senegalia massiliensis TaxID=1720316 RepID=UPI0010314989|nr:site-2 protease family protein [Senegalia massiliensis]